ncbi:MAG: glycosyltransferase family 4 protein [Pseudomonadales bacterium]|nr:glycosyltransferase family 4 protein [Pseudomonadales bacterium]
MKSIRLGLVGPLPPPAGGMARQTLQLAELLTQQGVQVELIRTNPDYQPAFISRVKGIRALFRLFGYLVCVYKTVAKVDMFHIMANSGWSWYLFVAPVVWIAWFKKIPVVLNYRGGEAAKFFSKSWLWIHPTMKKVQMVVVPSPFLSKIFDERNIATHIVPNVLDLERFQPSKGARGKKGAPHIIVTRNLEEIYGIGTALKAFALIRKQFPEALLTIAGSGPLLKELQETTKTLGIDANTDFCGRLDHAQIAALYQDSDLMLNPSLEDNSPNSIIEALASGVPVISTNVGGIPYLIQSGKNGMLVEPNDAKEMAGAALRILGDEELKDRLVAQGSQDVKKFDQNVVVSQLLDLYVRVLC